MTGAADWLAGRYGCVLFALLLTGAWAEATKLGGYIRARHRLRRVRLNPLYNTWECGRVVPTPLGRLVGVMCRSKMTLLTQVRLARTAGLAGLRSLAHASREEVERILDLAEDASSGKVSHLVLYYDAPFDRYRRLYGWTREDVKRLLTEGIMGAVAYTWDNGGADGLWTTGANWSPDAPAGGPVAGDTVTFNATSVANCSINTAASVTSLTIAAGYTGIASISAGNSLTTSGGFVISGAGTFTTNNNSVTIGSWDQSAGTANLGSSTVTCNGAYTHSAGTFNDGTSTWVVAGNGTYSGAGITNFALDMTTAEFYSLTVNAGVTMTLGTTTKVWTLFNVILNGTISAGVTSYWKVASGASITVGGSGTFTGTGIIDIYSNANWSFGGGSHSVALISFREILNTSPTVTLTANLTSTGAGGADGAIALYKASGADTGILVLDTNGFNVTTTASGFSTGSRGSASFSSAVRWSTGTHSLYDFHTGLGTPAWVDYGSASVTISTGNYTDLSTSASWVVGTATLTLTGASPTWRQDAAADHVYNFRFNGSGTITVTTNVFRAANQLRFSAGIFTPSVDITNCTSYLVDGGTLTWNRAGNFQAPVTMTSGAINYAVIDTFTSPHVYSGGTATLTAIQTHTWNASLTISGASFVISAPAATSTLTFNADFTMTSGAFGSNVAYTLDWNSTVSVTGGTFNAPTGNTWTSSNDTITFQPTTFNHDNGRFIVDRAGAQTINTVPGIVFDEVESLGGGTKTFNCGCTINTEIETAGTIEILGCPQGGGATMALSQQLGLLERKQKLPHEYRGCC